MATLRWGAATHSGLVRDANEDAYVADALVFGVADGMGSHRAGEVASALASNILRDRLSTGAANIDVVVAAILEANAAIFQAAHANAAQQGMGTTVTALVVLATADGEPDRLALVNVGDSRTYLFRDGTLTRATVDHSYVQELVATGHITETEARTHPRRNIVTRALGIEPTVRVDSWVLPVVRGDRYILCSDGLVNEVPDHEIADVAAGLDDPQRAADELVAMANRHGGRDNVTVIVVDVVEGPEPAIVVEADGAVTGRMDVVPDDPDATEVLGAEDEADATVPLPTAAPIGGDTLVLTTDEVEAPRPRRRLTVGMFLFLLTVAAILTLTITLIAVAVSNDDDSPTQTTVPATQSEPTEPATSPSEASTGESTATTVDVASTTTVRSSGTRPPATTTP